MIVKVKNKTVHLFWNGKHITLKIEILPSNFILADQKIIETADGKIFYTK